MCVCVCVREHFVDQFVEGFMKRLSFVLVLKVTLSVGVYYAWILQY